MNEFDYWLYKGTYEGCIEAIKQSNQKGSRLSGEGKPKCFGCVSLPFYDDRHYYCMWFWDCVKETEKNKAGACKKCKYPRKCCE